MTLRTPDLIWGQAIDVVTRRHVEHLAKLERERNLAPRTIEPLKTVDVLAFEGARLKTDKLPCALIGVFGLTDLPRRKANDKLDMPWIMAVEVTVAGKDRADTVKRRDWYAMTVVECLEARLPRAENPVGRLVLRDIDLTAGDDPFERVQTLAQAQILFDVDVADSVDLAALPRDDSPLAPGGAGGRAPDPYADPEPSFPAPPNTVTTTTVVTDDPQEDPTP